MILSGFFALFSLLQTLNQSIKMRDVIGHLPSLMATAQMRWLTELHAMTTPEKKNVQIEAKDIH